MNGKRVMDVERTRGVCGPSIERWEIDGMKLGLESSEFFFCSMGEIERDFDSSLVSKMT
jgi:hypothetical protein